MGVVALLSAAKALAAKPAVRPTLFLAVTAEEKGLLGSKYYVDNPLIPLEKTIFNLNNDGGGYNSTEHVAIIGYGRTGTDAQIQASVENLGLKVAENPMPDENLFDRSDNVNFALKGVPSIDYAPGALSFDVEVTKYYHQVPDEAGSIDYDYLLRFCQAYARAARLISDKENVPIWTEGDKYEAAGKRLYGKE
jgi:Zn-dependent M28 family amino/carboxypeptidase